MECASCRHHNEEGAVFCEECGRKLIRGCSQCGTELKPTSKFCLKCGARTDLALPQGVGLISKKPVDEVDSPRADLDDERKTITALFADLKGSTSLIEGLDPEAARELLDPALTIMMDAVCRYDGLVAQVMGDGIYALFGAPLTVEDHPQRALACGLGHAALDMRPWTCGPSYARMPRKCSALATFRFAYRGAPQSRHRLMLPRSGR